LKNFHSIMRLSSIIALLVGGACVANAQSADAGKITLTTDDQASITTVDGGKTWLAIIPASHAVEAANKISAGHQGADMTSAGYTAVFPNPTAGAFSIQYGLEQPGDVSVVLHDSHGSEVLRAFEGPRGTGEHTLQLDAAQLPDGVYFYRVVSSGAIIAGSTMVVAR
jgi:hypothetical protein